MSEAMVKDAVLAETSRLTSLKALALAHPKPFIATGLAVLVLTAGTVVFYDSIFGEEVPDYTLIDFDPSVARAFAQGLVDLGHPQWEGRMSGSEQEMLTSESIMDNFSKMGYQVKLNTFDVPMFSIDSEPIFGYCTPGTLGQAGLARSCGPEDVNREQSFFEHRSEFVIQGYSGSIQLNGFEDAPLVDLGHVNDENIDWASASGGIILISAGGDSSQNAIVWENGPTNGALGAIMVNEEYNCDKLVQGDCVPIFKAGIYSRIIAANQGQVPEDFPLISVAKSVGQELRETFNETDAKIIWNMDVDNSGDITVRVPCGTHYGKSNDLLMVGAHHDTVYQSAGAVDDTSGTATVLELARQFATIINTTGQADRTISFCTWGGEEEGLWGSKSWVQQNADDLAQNLRFYANLDMNHADKDLRENGRMSLFMNYEDDHKHVSQIADKFSEDYPDLWAKYQVNILHFDHDDMGYNSDHGPFVFDLPDNTRGRVGVCYGSGSWEYHTYLDRMDRFNEESLTVSAVIYGSYLKYLAWDDE